MLRSTLAVIAILGFSSFASANYVGSQSQYFNVNPGNMDFFTVHSSRTLPKNTVKTTIFFDYAGNIHYSSPSLKNNVMQAQLGFAVGVSDKMSFSLAGTGIIDYNDKEGDPYTDDNFTHIRANLKYRWCDCESGGWATVLSLGYGVADPDYFVGDEDDYTAAVLMAYDRLITDRVRFAANIGYRYGSSGDPLTSPALAGYPAFTETRGGSDVLASVGLNVILNDKLTGVTEVYATLPTDEFFDFKTEAGDLDQKGAEILLGANYKAGESLDLGFGGTVGVFSQAQNADWRLFVGIGYAFGGEVENSEFNMMGSSSAPAPKKSEAKPISEPVKIENAPVLKEFNISAKFPSGSSNLTAEAKKQIDPVGKFLQTNKEYRMVFVEGHTDSAGAEAFNQSLSERRARMIKNYIMRTYDVPDTKIQAIGFGETSPVADNSTPVGRAKNRRVIVKVK